MNTVVFYGKISSSWRKNGDKIEYTIEVPLNTMAEVQIGEDRHVFSAGTYEIVTEVL